MAASAQTKSFLNFIYVFLFVIPYLFILFAYLLHIVVDDNLCNIGGTVVERYTSTFQTLL